MVLFDEAKKIVEEAVSAGKLCVVIGRCRVQYAGRAASKLSEGDRMLVIKHDGTFLVHQSKGMRAINYQGPGAAITAEMDEHEGRKVLVVKATRTKPLKEEIKVVFFEVDFASSFKLEDDEKLKVFGTERELADLMMQDLSMIEKGLVPLQQESSMRKGAMDIVATDFRGRMVVIEVKRRSAGLDAVTQLARYVEEVGKRADKQTRGILCAPEITENALRMLEKQGLEYYKLDYEIHNPRAEIKGLQKKQSGLSEFMEK
ncbi:endonuclease NucS [Candidatus Micrarchaeota archaeon]|nr:endonuclease NucS [Candidatus Micrarchaeota archaeon]